MIIENCLRLESLSLSGSLVFLIINLLFLGFKTWNLKIVSGTFVLYDRIRGSESILNFI